ncbi:MAG: YqgE/AlgH family protein [Deltaproteobacteria bacterium]|nr:YqgE/AlgH family protein [Deltaproteobacteria bacterium]
MTDVNRRLVMRPGWVLLVLALVVLGSWPGLRAWVDGVEQGRPEVRAGDLLVARPGGTGRLFAGTVVLMLAFGPERILGVVVNRPPAEEAGGADAPRWGGPVDSEHPILVAQAREAPPGTEPIGAGLYWREGSGDWPQGALRARTFQGYSGWAPGQLEDEILRGSWIVRRAEAGLVFGQNDRDTWLIALGESIR